MMNDKLEFYTDDAGDWRWRYKAVGNNEIMGEGGEGYKDMNSAYYGALRVLGFPPTPQADSLLASATANTESGISDALFRGEEMILVKFVGTGPEPELTLDPQIKIV